MAVTAAAITRLDRTAIWVRRLVVFAWWFSWWVGGYDDANVRLKPVFSP